MLFIRKESAPIFRKIFEEVMKSQTIILDKIEYLATVSMISGTISNNLTKVILEPFENEGFCGSFFNPK